MPYRLPQVQNQHTFQNMIPHVNQRGVTPDLGLGMAPRNYAVAPASYVGSAYPAVPGLQYPMAYQGGVMTNKPASGPSSPVPHAAVNSHSTASSSVSASSGGQVEGCRFFLI